MQPEIVGSIASAIAMVLVAIVNVLGNKKTSEKIDENHKESRKDMEIITLRHSIIQMIQSDISNFYFFNKIPSNYNAITDSFSEYESLGGNHYVKQQVDDYLEWYASLEDQLNEYKKKEK